MTEWKDLLDQTCAGCVMQQFVQCFSNVCVDDVLNTIQDDFLKLPDDPLIPRVVLLVLEGDIKFEFWRVQSHFWQWYSKPDAFFTICAFKIDKILDVDAFNDNIKFSMLTYFLCNNVIWKVFGIQGYINVFSLNRKRMISCYVHNVGVPIYGDMLSDVS